MKNLFLIIIMLAVSISGFSQDYGVEEDSSKYFGSLSVGYGTSHGGLGAKLLFLPRRGDGNTGFFGSIGTFNDEIFWAGGIQSGGLYGNFYSTWSVGTLATIDTWVNGNYNRTILTGTSLTVGNRINLTRNKRLFIDLGVGYSYAFDNEYEYPWYAIDAAFGVRF